MKLVTANSYHWSDSPLRPHPGEAHDVPEVDCDGGEGLGYQGLSRHESVADGSVL